MSELYKRIETLCKNKGANVTEMCKVSGASRGSLTDLKMGRTTGLSSTTLSKIASYLEVSVDQLLGNNEETKKPTDQKVDGLRGTGYYDLTPENRAMIDSLIDSLLRSQSAE